jgi:hypothetical protein
MPAVLVAWVLGLKLLIFACLGHSFQPLGFSFRFPFDLMSRTQYHTYSK